MHAIVGAGPAGLYLGIKLHQLDVRDVMPQKRHLIRQLKATFSDQPGLNS